MDDSTSLFVESISEVEHAPKPRKAPENPRVIVFLGAINAYFAVRACAPCNSQDLRPRHASHSQVSGAVASGIASGELTEDYTAAGLPDMVPKIALSVAIAGAYFIVRRLRRACGSVAVHP